MKRTASQVGRSSRRKGKAFECWCARYFTQWTGLKWESTRNSGRTDLKGDIYAVSRPDLPLIVECKNDKRYSTVAIIRNNKAIIDLVHKYYGRMLIVKNDAGVWVLDNDHLVIPIIDNICFGGNKWFQLADLTSFEIDGVIFDANRMEAAGNRRNK